MLSRVACWMVAFVLSLICWILSCRVYILGKVVVGMILVLRNYCRLFSTLVNFRCWGGWDVRSYLDWEYGKAANNDIIDRCLRLKNPVWKLLDRCKDGSIGLPHSIFFLISLVTSYILANFFNLYIGVNVNCPFNYYCVWFTFIPIV